MINIKFPDGSVKQFESGVTPLDVAKSISEGLARMILAASFNGEEWDISRPICSDGEIQLFKWDDKEGKHAFWHTSAHLLAEALQELYDGIQFGIGPAIENGFYYDIDPGENVITSADFPKIEKKMQEIVARKEAVIRADISKADALKSFVLHQRLLLSGSFRQCDHASLHPQAPRKIRHHPYAHITGQLHDRHCCHRCLHRKCAVPPPLLS